MTRRMDLQMAGVSALLAIPALILSGVFLVLFFGGAGDQYGPLNDFFVAVTMALLVLPAKALLTVVGTAGGQWFRVLTWLNIAGLTVAIAGQLLLIAGIITLAMSFVTGSLGLVPILAWSGAQAYLGLRFGTPSRSIGWTLAAVLTLSLLVTLSWAIGAEMMVWTLTAALVAALTGYLGLLGRQLLAHV